MASFFYFPLRAGSKEPLLPGDWRQHSTDDPAQVQAWYDAGHNIGLDCGKSDILVVDLDPGSVRPELPPTFERVTPRGGSHILFQGACTGAARKNVLGPHIDTRSTGGYIVWDGWTEDGAYGASNGLALAPTPAWICEKLAAAETRTQALVTDLDTPANLARAKLWMGQAEPAEDDASGYAFACRCVDLGLSDDAALTLMEETGWLKRCGFPFPFDEQLEWMQRKLENAREYMQNEAGAWAVGDPTTRFAHAQPAETTFRVHDEAAQDAWQEPTWLAPHALPHDSLVMLYGAKGSFKSFIALDLALHVASARSGWGTSFDERRSVVYCAGEGPTSVGKFRRPAWRSTYPDVEGVLPFYLVKDKEFPKAASAESICDFIEGVRPLRPALVIIDTLHVFMTGLSEIKDDDCGIAIESLKQIKREVGCVVLVIHHAGKDAGQGARGHSSLTADMDVVHEAIGHSGSKALALWNRYQKDADERQTPWCFEGRPAGRSLVFHPISEAEHKNLTVATAELSDKMIGPLLAQAGAKGEDRAITSDAFASILYQGDTDQSPEATLAGRNKIARQLSARAKHSVYAHRERHGWLWCIPA